MIAIPNMEKPKSCFNCFAYDGEFMECRATGECVNETFYDKVRDDCPLIEIDDGLIKKLQESAIVINAVYKRLKKMVNNSGELKTELMGTNPNLTIFDEANAIQDVESVGE